MSKNPFISEGISTKKPLAYKLKKEYIKIKDNIVVNEIKIDTEIKRIVITYKALRLLVIGKPWSISDYRIFNFLLNQMKRNQDQVYLNTARMTKVLELSGSQVSKTINKLIDLGFISRIKGYNYYINPYLIFYGNRIEFLEQIDPKLVKCIKII